MNTPESPTTVSYAILRELPESHALRNKPLGALNAERRNLNGKNWIPIKRWRIACNTYNELKPVWTQTTEFRVPITEVSAGHPTPKH